MQDCSDVMQLLLKTQTEMQDMPEDDPQVGFFSVLLLVCCFCCCSETPFSSHFREPFNSSFRMNSRCHGWLVVSRVSHLLHLLLYTMFSIHSSLLQRVVIHFSVSVYCSGDIRYRT